MLYGRELAPVAPEQWSDSARTLLFLQPAEPGSESKLLHIIHPTANKMNAGALWSEAQAPDGRTYYYNTQTKQTQWTKPAELMTAAEVKSRPFLYRAQANDIAASLSQPAMERIHC